MSKRKAEEIEALKWVAVPAQVRDTLINHLLGLPYRYKATVEAVVGVLARAVPVPAPEPEAGADGNPENQPLSPAPKSKAKKAD